jgi:hypothetical protein
VLDEPEHRGQPQAGAMVGPFVVKNGSKIRDRTSSAMPMPVSLTATST